ncbi:MAG TPA: dual specificity protein phosphatase family protein, partial [Chthoniobacterales bacterium]
VGSSYFGIGRDVYRKANGRLPWSTRLVLAPCLIGQYASLIYYRRKCRPWDAVTPKLWIGGRLTPSQANEAVESGVTAVLDLTAEFSEPSALREVSYRNIPVMDLTAPTQDQLLEIASFIADRREETVYVHCKIGFSRSAAAIAAYLIMSGQARGAQEALAIISCARPSIIIRPEVVRALNQFEASHRRTEFSDPTFVLAPAGRALA